MGPTTLFPNPSPYPPTRLPAAAAATAAAAAPTVIGILLNALPQGLDLADGLLGDSVHGKFTFVVE